MSSDLLRVPVTVEIDLNAVQESIADEIREQYIRRIVADELPKYIPTLVRQVCDELVRQARKQGMTYEQ